MRLVAGGLLILILGLKGRAQAPSVEEQQYLFSVLPLIETGELSNAEKRLLSGIEQYPRSAILYNALGIVYHKQAKSDKAAASFRKAIEILPSFTAAQLQLASIDQEQGNRTEAAQLYRSAGDSTTNFDALAAAGLGLAECEDYAGAARVLDALTPCGRTRSRSSTTWRWRNTRAAIRHLLWSRYNRSPQNASQTFFICAARC